jgi:hypothetical protein
MVGSAAVVGAVDVVDVGALVDGVAKLNGAQPSPVFNVVMGATTPRALRVEAVAVGGGVVRAVVGAVVARSAAVLGVVGVVLVAVDGEAAGVGAAAGSGAANDRMPIAKPATSVTQPRDIAALRPRLSRRRRQRAGLICPFAAYASRR